MPSRKTAAYKISSGNRKLVPRYVDDRNLSGAAMNIQSAGMTIRLSHQNRGDDQKN
jgi:hypothetical protein